MTKDEALKLALKALKTIDEAMPFPVAKLAIKECEAALEAKGEPVQNQLMALIDENQRLRAELKFNTTPPQRTWVGLTDEHKEGLICMTDPNPEPHHLRELIDVVEFQLKEKNT